MLLLTHSINAHPLDLEVYPCNGQINNGEAAEAQGNCADEPADLRYQTWGAVATEKHPTAKASKNGNKSTSKPGAEDRQIDNELYRPNSKPTDGDRGVGASAGDKLIYIRRHRTQRKSGEGHHGVGAGIHSADS